MSSRVSYLKGTIKLRCKIQSFVSYFAIKQLLFLNETASMTYAVFKCDLRRMQLENMVWLFMPTLLLYLSGLTDQEFRLNLDPLKHQHSVFSQLLSGHKKSIRVLNEMGIQLNYLQNLKSSGYMQNCKEFRPDHFRAQLKQNLTFYTSLVRPSLVKNREPPLHQLNSCICFINIYMKKELKVLSDRKCSKKNLNKDKF